MAEDRAHDRAKILGQMSSITLEAFCTPKHLELLNAIDKLRSQGIDRYISLPQIIVCGDQSSGKSSVLEALSGVPFPVKSTLCTRFPIELVLRKTARVGTKVSIIPDQDTSGRQDARYDRSILAFEQRLENYEDLPGLINTAKARMGIITNGKAFSKDRLRIEISGPDRPHLTIVDLPGLIHTENKLQASSDVDLIKQVVQKYMKEPRSIILAVISAKNDYANQIVLELARKADPKGGRTLGVITKPDTLLPDSYSERTYISLAKNQEIYFNLGWHMLRNTDSEAGTWTLAERDELEAHFFAQTSWTSLLQSSLGIKNLRDRLSNLLLQQITAELPALIADIESKTMHCQVSLSRLGRPRTSLDEQREYLVRIGEQFQTLLRAACDGTYRDAFFGDAETYTGYQKHFRAVVQNLSEKFSEEMDRSGRRYQIRTENDLEDDPKMKTTHSKKTLRSHAEFIEKIMKQMERSRGCELPSMFNPMIVAKIFKIQSSPWRNIAVDYVQKVWVAARIFLHHLIIYTADQSTVKEIMRTVIDPKLEDIRSAVSLKTRALLKPHEEGHPITYNRDFMDSIPKIRSERKSADISRLLKDRFNSSTLEEIRPSTINLKSLHDDILKEVLEKDERHHAAADASDQVEAYYRVALKRFVDDMSVEVIETCLVNEMKKILSPLEMLKMPTAVMSRVAGETNESRAARLELEKQLAVLTKGMKTCQEQIAVHTPGTDTDDEDPDLYDASSQGSFEIDFFDHTDQQPKPMSSTAVNTPPYETAALPDVPSDPDDFWEAWRTTSKRVVLPETIPEPQTTEPEEARSDVPPPDNGLATFTSSKKKSKKSKRLAKRALSPGGPAEEPRDLDVEPKSSGWY